MTLENLYRVFFDSQEVVLEDALSHKTLWSGLVRNIPLEYLNYTVIVAMPCLVSKIVVIIRA